MTKGLSSVAHQDFSMGFSPKTGLNAGFFIYIQTQTKSSFTTGFLSMFWTWFNHIITFLSALIIGYCTWFFWTSQRSIIVNCKIQGKTHNSKKLFWLLSNNSVNTHLFLMIQCVLESAKVGKHNDVNNRTIFETSKIHLCYVFIHQGEFLSHR